ncbi:MAG: DegV family protein [Eubacterium sp.]
MRDYVVITDVASDLPADIAKQLGVVVMPMSFEVDGKVYHHYSDAREMSLDEFYNKLRSGSMPTTTQINPATYEEFFKTYLEEGKDILCMVFTSGMSGTFQSATLAANMLQEDYPDQKIYCVDTLSASIGEGMFVYNAMKKKESGFDIDRLKEWIEEKRHDARHWFMVEDLLHLMRGGRVSSVEAVVGTALKIKPVLSVDNEGKLIVVNKVRGAKKGIAFMLEKMREEGTNLEEQTVFVAHTDNPEMAEQIKDKIISAGLAKDVIVTEIGPIIGAHVGPGMVALSFMR